jgi:hypothetical protein
MSPAERHELATLLAEIDEPRPDATPQRSDPYLHDPALRRARRVALFVSAGCCVVLAGWIVVLAATLPHRFDAHHWRAVWVNFDVFLLAAFAATAWAVWRERQIVILLLVLTGTMLCCDAWFDVGTSLATSGVWISLASAIFAELPLAILAFIAARRLLRATVAAASRPGEGIPDSDTAGLRAPAGVRGYSVPAGPAPSLRRTPLAGQGIDEALPLSRAQRRARQSPLPPAGAE